jgi:hypothetical protein
MVTNPDTPAKRVRDRVRVSVSEKVRSGNSVLEVVIDKKV